MGCCLDTEDDKITDRPYYSLDISIRCWARETHGLYDYDNNSLEEQFLRINNTCSIVNDYDTRVDGVAPRDAIVEKIKTLFIATFKNGKYWVYHSQDFTEEEKLKNPVDQVWISLRNAVPAVFPGRYNKYLGYRLAEGDIVKFGRVRFKIKKLGNCKLNKIEQERIIKYNSQFDVSMNERLLNRLTNRVSRRTEQLSRSKSIDSNISPYNSIDGESIQENIHEKIAKIRDTEGDKDFNKIRKEAQCRICLGEEEDEEIEENPLISPCKCTGTLQYIHLDCLKKWLDSKIHTKLTEFTFSYNWKNLVCELCGMRLKDNYIINGKETYVLDYLRPDSGCYMILESYTNTPHKTIHVLVSNKRNNPYNADIEYCVGRSNEAAVRITDISVSRIHSSITYSEGDYYVRDEAAKFGTLIYLRDPVAVPKRRSFELNLQLGRFAAKIKPYRDERVSDNESEIGLEPTYEEDCPYLPKGLLDFLENQSVKLGLQNFPTRFDDLQKIREDEIKNYEKDSEDTSSVENNQRETAMMFNTVRDTNIETSQPLGPNQTNTQAQRRNSDLEVTLDQASQNIQEMNLEGIDRRILAPRRMNTSENNSERGDEDRGTSARLNLQTELGIIANNQTTNPSPMISNPGIHDSITNSLRDRSIQGTGHSIDTSLNNKKDKKKEPLKKKKSLRQTRARMMNLTLGNEGDDSEGSNRIEERKSELDEESDPPEEQWAVPPEENNRIQAFEPLDSPNRGSENAEHSTPERNRSEA
ncbi:unnamed protein product [Moneuplotes crassus]|uniref:Uncharacterized protein n=1 Tax=Euplotes crassus TaxID=5936 RepID=A0AAD2DBN9_EUPCR|nr:unnamed protein product [Moneuplotes crassus]